MSQATKNKTARTSWGLRLQMTDEEYSFYELIVFLWREEFIKRADFLAAEARLLGYGFLNNSGNMAA